MKERGKSDVLGVKQERVGTLMVVSGRRVILARAGWRLVVAAPPAAPGRAPPSPLRRLPAPFPSTAALTPVHLGFA